MFCAEVLLRASIVGLLGLALALSGCDKRGAPAPQASTDASAPAPDEAPARPGPPTTPSGAPDRSHAGETAPNVPFTAPDGRKVTLADYRGTPVLVNLWATWCAPCVTEMPTLDRLAGTLKGVVLLAIAQDLDGAAKVGPYWAKAGLKTLRPALDPATGLSLAYKANLPTTVLLDSHGKEVWRVTGPRDWTTDETRRLIAEAH